MASDLLDLNELDRLCKAATPGPWTTTKPGNDADGWAKGVIIAATERGQCVYASPPGGVSPWANQNYIAAANPDAVGKLIATVRRLYAELNERSGFAPHHWTLNSLGIDPASVEERP